MCHSNSILALTLMVVASCAASAQADGGRVQFSQVIAPYRITVFMSPTPLVADAVDISVLLQDAVSGKVVQDAVVDLELRSDTAKTIIRQRATTEASTNKLLQSAKTTLPSAGVWQVAIQIQGKSTIDVTFEMTAYQMSGDTATVIVCLAIRFIMIISFLTREHLVARQSPQPVRERNAHSLI